MVIYYEPGRCSGRHTEAGQAAPEAAVPCGRYYPVTVEEVCGRVRLQGQAVLVPRDGRESRTVPCYHALHD